MPPGVVGYDPKYRKINGYDPPLANKLLDYFGYKRGGDGFRNNPDGSRLTVVYTSEPQAINREYDELWKKSLDVIGLRFESRKGPFSDHIKAAEACQLAMWGSAWHSDYPDGENFMQLYYGPNTHQSNHACYRSPVFDKLYDQIKDVADSVDMFGDVARVAACLPGTSLTGVPTRERAEGLIRVKLGPISASFRGAARIERDPQNLSGRIVGTGSDQRSRSSTQSEIRYQLIPIEQGVATRVELSIGYSLRGMLAQIAREGLVRDLASRLTADFARNLERQLSGAGPDRSVEGPRDLDAFSLLIDLLRARVRRAIRRVLGR